MSGKSSSSGSGGGGGSGAPMWMVTFADLMALMMTFFVLLYSFSSIDETKYEQIVASMASGFGAVLVAPKASPTPNLGPPSMLRSPMSSPMKRGSPGTKRQSGVASEILVAQVQTSLQKEIAQGTISVEATGDTVIIRFPEEITFPPGSDTLNEQIGPVVKRLSEALVDAPGDIMIAGHTDDRPIANSRYKSNWRLSTDRAVSVLEMFEKVGKIDRSRLTAVGYADTRPIAANDTPEGRAKNRRVEIAIVQRQ